MRGIIFILALAFSVSVFSQNDALAKNYFEQGEYEKALSMFTKLARTNPSRTDYVLFIIKCNQQLENFSEAEKIIRKKLSGRNVFPKFYVELGYNYSLQDQDSLAQVAYQQAFRAIEDKPFYAYTIGRAFSDYSLLDEAARTFERAMELDPERDYNPQLAKIYGEQGELEKMFEKYIDIIRSNSNYRPSAQRNFAYYVNEDPNNEGNVILRKILLKRLQGTPDILYNELLSWLFIQQKDYRKAFIQEKAIFKRTNEDATGIIDLMHIAMEDGNYEDAQDIIGFVIENSNTFQEKMEANQYLMDIKIKLAAPSEYDDIEKEYLELLEYFGEGPLSYALQIDFNRFLAFQYGKSETGIENLKRLLKNRFTIYQEARIKLTLADILVFNERFNEALIYYSQVQKKVKNDVLAQEARFKVARTSYFKGDFEWAQIQLDVLKKSASQLIANDAMELSLMIRDNSLEDSTQTALKKFARADLLDLQNKPQEAIVLLEDILQNHKGEKIEDEALLKMGIINEKMSRFERAEANYLKLIEFYKEDIVADDAHFRLAKLYETQLDQIDKAKEFYEQIIFNFEDSIYFVEARKRYRMLRGDAIN